MRTTREEAEREVFGPVGAAVPPDRLSRIEEQWADADKGPNGFMGGDLLWLIGELKRWRRGMAHHPKANRNLSTLFDWVPTRG